MATVESGFNRVDGQPEYAPALGILADVGAQGGQGRSALGTLRRWIFGLDLAETTCEVRGFRGGSADQRYRVESVGASFLHGYHAAVEIETMPELVERLDLLKPVWRGFAYEGAGMALFLRDQIFPVGADLFNEYLGVAGRRYQYLIHVGAGWAMARLPFLWSVDSMLGGLDPIQRWLAVDGYGFHAAYFHPQRFVVERQREPRMKGYAARAFDQGLGRAMWFVHVMQPEALARTIETFEVERHADLWAGVGLASGYAGGVTDQALSVLRHLAGPHAPALAQGVTFAAAAHADAGIEPSHTALACRVLGGRSMGEVVDIFHRSRPQGEVDGEVPRFELWRQAIQSHY